MSATLRFLIIGFLFAATMITMNMADEGGENGSAEAGSTTQKGTTNGTTPSTTPSSGCPGNGSSDPTKVVAILVPALLSLVHFVIQCVLIILSLVIRLILGSATGSLPGLGSLGLLNNLPLLNGILSGLPLPVLKDLDILNILSGVLPTGDDGGNAPSVPIVGGVLSDVGGDGVGGGILKG